MFLPSRPITDMPFETKQDVLDWYERQPRTLTPEFVDSIDWRGVRDHELDERLVPVLFYMRDVETLTDMYYHELRPHADRTRPCHQQIYGTLGHRRADARRAAK